MSSRSSRQPLNSFDRMERVQMPDINLDALRSAVESRFRATCTSLQKMGKGGFHYIYTLTLGNSPYGVSEVVARVATPACPKYKIESEIATMRYIAQHTSVPTPQVYAWNSDASNPVGAEYMIMEKAAGVDAGKAWDEIDLPKKTVFVEDLAGYLHQLFKLRFDKFGALYIKESSDCTLLSPSSTDSFIIGPSIEGLHVVRHRKDVFAPPAGLHGPHNTAFDYLAANTKGELLYLGGHKEHAIAVRKQMVLARNRARRRNILKYNPERVADYPSIETDRALHIGTSPEELESSYATFVESCKKWVEVFRTYGAHPVDSPDPDPVFSPVVSTLFVWDPRLSNFMLDPTTGHLTAFLDIEGADLVPLWVVTPLPKWLSNYSLRPDGRDDEDTANPTAEDADPEVYEEALLRKAFIGRMTELDSNGEWRRAFEEGGSFRRAYNISRDTWPDAEFEDRLGYPSKLLEWMAQNLGVPRPETPVEKEDDEGTGEDEPSASASDSKSTSASDSDADVDAEADPEHG